MKRLDSCERNELNASVPLSSSCFSPGEKSGSLMPETMPLSDTASACSAAARGRNSRLSVSYVYSWRVRRLVKTDVDGSKT